jgi:hypothetical protein
VLEGFVAPIRHGCADADVISAMVPMLMAQAMVENRFI